MRICYIHQYFCTNEGSAGTRSYDVARHLAAMGHDVTVICGVEDKSGLTMGPWYKPIRRVRMDGFDILICNVWYSNKMRMLRRIWAFFHFAVLATIAACFACGRPDVFFSTSQPLTVGVPGYIAASVKRASFVFEVRDLWPEALLVAGDVEPGPMVRMAERLEEFLYRKAERILLVSPGFEKRLLERGYPQWKLKTILLGADAGLFENLTPDAGFREEHGLGNKTVAIYAGVLGRANGIDYIIDAANCVKDREDIAIVLLGGGMEKQRLLGRTEQLGLSNVHFVDYVPKTELPGILAACDIALMILKNVGERPVTPNKLFDYMLSGLPIVVNFPGPTLERLEADAAGMYADPEDPQELARRIIHWADCPEEAKAIGTRARDTALRKYDRRKIAEELADTFMEVLGAGRSKA